MRMNVGQDTESLECERRFTGISHMFVPRTKDTSHEHHNPATKKKKKGRIPFLVFLFYLPLSPLTGNSNTTAKSCSLPTFLRTATKGKKKKQKHNLVTKKEKKKAQKARLLIQGCPCKAAVRQGPGIVG